MYVIEEGWKNGTQQQKFPTEFAALVKYEWVKYIHSSDPPPFLKGVE